MNEEHLNEATDRDELASAKEERRQELQRSFNPQRLKVIRKELFAGLRDPAVTIRNGNITFNTACINGFENVVYVNLLIDEEQGLFAVKACDENDKEALRWCVAKPDKRKSRRMRCPDFTDSLFEKMRWDKRCRYKVLGYQIKFEDERYMVFDLKVKQVFNEKPKKGEEPVDENGEVQQIDTRKGYFPDDIAHTFGVPLEQYKRETEITEMGGFVNIAMLTGPRREKSQESTQESQESTQESTQEPEEN